MDVCLFVCLLRLGFSPQGFMLAKQVLYHLSHISSPFCYGYFGDGGGSLKLCAQVSLELQTSQSQPLK
jgi:hypothetical protein